MTDCVAAFSQSIGKEDMKIVGMLLLIFVSSVAAGGRVPAQYGLKPCKDPVVCVADPCEVTTCPEFPEADCISDFCDCNARFFLGFREVTNKCQRIKKCANIGTVTQVDCDTMDQCPGTAICDTASDTCCCGETQFACVIPPCDSATCPKHPDATCTNEFCNGCCCEAKFFLDNGDHEVTDDCQVDIVIN